jgi:hypothetical protein
MEQEKNITPETSSEELITDEDREKIAKIIQESVDDEGFVNFGEIAHQIFGQQTQSASRYIDGVIPGWPNLGEDLRFKGSTENYHFVRIHKDDIEEFIRRKRDYIAHPEKYEDKITRE